MAIELDVALNTLKINVNNGTGQVDIDGTFSAGNQTTGDKTEIEADGTAEFLGDSTVWDDLVGSLIGRRLSSVAGKVDYNWAENTITMQPGGVITTTNDLIIFNYQYPHACITDGEMRLHIHWEQPNANQVEWTLDYRIQSNGSAKTTAWTRVTANSTDDSVFTYVSGTLNQITELATIDMTGAGISATVQFRLARTDVTATDIEAVFVDAHVLRDTGGSRTEYTK